MTCPWSPYGTAMSFSMTIPGRFSNRCSGGRPPRDSGVLRGARNRYSVLASSMELLIQPGSVRRGGPSEDEPPLRIRPGSLEGFDRVVALAVVLLHDHRRHRGLAVLAGVHRRVRQHERGLEVLDRAQRLHEALPGR